MRTTAPVWGASTISVGLTRMPTWSTSAGVGAEEDEVAGLERLAGRDGRAGVVLVLGGARELDAGGLVGGLDEAGAVEAAGAVAAPAVGGAELGERVADRGAGRRRSVAAAAAAPSAGASAGSGRRRPRRAPAST